MLSAFVFGIVSIGFGVLLIARRQTFAAEAARATSVLRPGRSDLPHQQHRAMLIACPIAGVVFIIAGLLVLLGAFVNN